MLDIPVIETERLRLSALSERHFEQYSAMLADPTSTRFVGDGQPLDRMNAWRSMAMLIGHWALRGYGMWAGELKDSGELIGRIGSPVGIAWPASTFCTFTCAFTTGTPPGPTSCESETPNVIAVSMKRGEPSRGLRNVCLRI